MEQVKVLLLDLGPANTLGDALQEILVPSFDLIRETLSEREAVQDRLSGAIPRVNPDLTFVVPAAGSAGQGRGALEACAAALAERPWIVALDEVGPDETFALLKLGAADFVTPPLKTADILPRMWRLLERARRGTDVPQMIKEKVGLRRLIGASPGFLEVVRKIPLVAKCDASVLISGETGTGKEVYARVIHYLSPRARKPFVPVNCGAIPVELLENELFGHERGAFTGAGAARPGLLAEAEGGTVFLDEVDCLPPLAQVKLLRFIQEKEYRPLGSTRTYQADVRVVGASNADCEEAVRVRRLRQDLYYRLNVIRLILPPLRERREDVPELARHFLAKYAARFGKGVSIIHPDAMRRLVLHDWPGNVRELEHVIERAVVLSERDIILPSDVSILEQGGAASEEPFRQAKAKIVEEFEKSYVRRLLVAYQGNITRAAQAARKNRRSFWQLIRKHRIDARGFKANVQGLWGEEEARP